MNFFYQEDNSRPKKRNVMKQDPETRKTMTPREEGKEVLGESLKSGRRFRIHHGKNGLLCPRRMKFISLVMA